MNKSQLWLSSKWYLWSHYHYHYHYHFHFYYHYCTFHRYHFNFRSCCYYSFHCCCYYYYYYYCNLFHLVDLLGMVVTPFSILLSPPMLQNTNEMWRDMEMSAEAIGQAIGKTWASWIQTFNSLKFLKELSLSIFHITTISGIQTPSLQKRVSLTSRRVLYTLSDSRELSRLRHHWQL